MTSVSKVDQALRRKTLSVRMFLLLIVAVEGLDMGILSACMTSMESFFGASPDGMGLLSMMQTVTQALCGPVWGALSDRLPRKTLLVVACILWGLVTSSMGLSNSIELLMVLRLINGVALSAIVPIAQSIVADTTCKKDLGLVFGLVRFAMILGQCAISQVGSPLASVEILGFPGWRTLFLSVGATSLLIAGVAWVWMPEPDRPDTHYVADISLFRHVVAEVSKLGRYLTVPTFAFIVLQGVFGMPTWNALGYFIHWLQYGGVSPALAGTLNSLLQLSYAFGNLLGGWIGDKMCVWSRWHGRILTAQATLVFLLVLLPLILLVIPPTNTVTFAIVLCIFGLTARWAGAACKYPILVDIVDSRSRGSVVAFDTALEGAAASFLGGPMVGLLQGWMGWEKPAKGVTPQTMLPSVRENNFKVLSHALTFVTTIPSIICLLTFCVLHWSYKRDAQRVEQKEAELQGAMETAATEEGSAARIRATTPASTTTA